MKVTLCDIFGHKWLVDDLYKEYKTSSATIISNKIKVCKRCKREQRYYDIHGKDNSEIRSDRIDKLINDVL